MKSRREQVTFILVILGVTIAVALTGYGVDTLFGSEWFPLLNIAVSAALTAALVILYFRQSAILESQRELLEAEMNRGVREQHTETLRERVREWHGNPDRENPKTLREQNSNNLPSAGLVSFTSAPDPTRISFAFEESEFRVIPGELEDDRYLQDLLENHAPELREQKQTIEELNSELDSLRGEFRTNFDYGKVVKKGEFRFEPQRFLSIWFFQHILRLERGATDTFDDLRNRMVSELKSSGHHPDEPIIWIRAEATWSGATAVYGVRYDSEDDPPTGEEHSKLKTTVEEIVHEIVDEVESEYPYETVSRAAEVLDEGEAAIKELEQILIEYDGKPIYSGECEYLREARIRPNTDQ